MNTYFFLKKVFVFELLMFCHTLFYKSLLIYAIRFGFMSRSRSKATALEYPVYGTYEYVMIFGSYSGVECNSKWGQTNKENPVTISHNLNFGVFW